MLSQLELFGKLDLGLNEGGTVFFTEKRGLGFFWLLSLLLAPPAPSSQARCRPDEIAGSAGRRRLRVGHNK